jgi:hypothetical protein
VPGTHTRYKQLPTITSTMRGWLFHEEICSNVLSLSLSLSLYIYIYIYIILGNGLASRKSRNLMSKKEKSMVCQTYHSKNFAQTVLIWVWQSYFLSTNIFNNSTKSSPYSPLHNGCHLCLVLLCTKNYGTTDPTYWDFKTQNLSYMHIQCSQVISTS